MELQDYMRQMAYAVYQKVIDMEKGLKCKFCGSDRVVRFGYTKGVQQYWCKRCKHKFANNQALPRMRSPMVQQSAALSMFYSGMSLKEIRRHLSQEYGNLSISRSTLERWINRYSKIAIDEANKYTPKTGGTWLADETVLRLGSDGKGGRNVWFFDLIDSDTRFLLASHMAFTRTTKAAQTLMEKAYKKAGKAPKRIITDGLNVYVDAIELTFGADSQHVQSTPFIDKDSTNQIERFHGTLKTRTAIMRGLKSLPNARHTLDGFLVYYNYLRPHDALDDKTPAEVAGIDFPYKSWQDVLRTQSYPTQKDYAVNPDDIGHEGIMTEILQDDRKATYKKRLKRRHKRRLEARPSVTAVVRARK